MNQSIRFLLHCVIGAIMVSGNANAQVNNDSELFKTLKEKDSVIFKIGFNKCEISRSAELMSEDLEFYHDKSGISHSKAEFVEVMENGLCSKNNLNQVYRYLIESSLEVFPLYDNGILYGALQNGKHFFSTQKNLSYKNSNNHALFSHLWILENNEWRLKRVISYNHMSKDIGKN